MRVIPRAGRATAPATATPSMARATCTAQSVRPGSLNSRVPSTGSMIHTRSCVEAAQVVAALLGEHGVAGRLAGEEVEEEHVGLPVADVARERRVVARSRTAPRGAPPAARPASVAARRRQRVVGGGGEDGTEIAYQSGRDLP